ncbi:MAG: response regulator transcription factor [Clostridiales bacterium]|nr:response regulator transcription factor [Clostridiales bacterium]
MLNNKKILVVDDEEKIADVIKSYLEKNDYAVYCAYSGREAVSMFHNLNPALIILDLMLPDITGEEVCRIVRKESSVPIIMLTAKVEESDVLKGFDIGADDYVTKPFSPRELVARVRALFKRMGHDISPMADTLVFNNGDITVNTMGHEVRKKGKIVNLTPSEYNILMALFKYPKRVFTRDELIDIALGEDYGGMDRIIDTHIKNLRQKIETNPKEPHYVITVHGVGYKFGGE